MTLREEKEVEERMALWETIERALPDNLSEADVILIGDEHDTGIYEHMNAVVLKTVRPSRFLVESRLGEAPVMNDWGRFCYSESIAHILGVPIVEVDPPYMSRLQKKLNELQLESRAYQRKLDVLAEAQKRAIRLRANGESAKADRLETKVQALTEYLITEIACSSPQFLFPFRESYHLNTVLEGVGKAGAPQLVYVGRDHVETLERVLPQHSLKVVRLWPDQVVQQHL